ncbi:MAG: spore protease, partial [Oscillospiraceae bacterium]|nr:spore protease [Oscillospiraceae bacterium]
MTIRTDLALESLEIAGEILPKGVIKKEEELEGVKMTTVDVEDEQGATALGKPQGKYITIELSPFKAVTDNLEGWVEIISKKIKDFLPQEGTVLVVGLGNSDITPDAVGPMTISSILATRHISGEQAEDAGLSGLRSVAAIAPGVLGQTGMETAEVVDSICKQINPSAVIVVDALASRSIDRLGCTVQISNSGISPGSGVQNARKELNKDTLGVPVIAIGIPTVVDMTTIAYDLLGEGAGSEKISTRGQTMMVTPREIDVIIEQAAKTAAFSINRALQPQL